MGLSGIPQWRDGECGQEGGAVVIPQGAQSYVTGLTSQSPDTSKREIAL